VVLDSMARTPLAAKVVTDEQVERTRIFVGPKAPKSRVAQLAKRVRVILAPLRKSPRRAAGRVPRGSHAGSPGLDLAWILKRLGSEPITSVLVEGGGEVNASFLFGGLAQRIAFFFAPIVLGGKDSKPGVGGRGAESLAEALHLRDVVWRRLGPDLLLEAML
jgi:diaminohydroxyphosphoribosylaminopyrimidine deaminase/5-amino-6-(5-phosphoribosylamino)uracil reductase